MFGTLKDKITSIWTADESWSDRMADRDYAATRDFVVLTEMIQKLAASGLYSRAVEIGCGDGKYSDFLRSNTPSVEQWIATDIDGPRIRRAAKELKQVKVHAASIIDVIETYNSPGTLFFSANVFGNIIPDEIALFYSQIKLPGTALAFLAGGLPIERSEDFVVRPNGIAFDHNYFALTRSSSLTNLDYRIQTYGDTAGTILYWVAGEVPPA